MSDIWPHGSGTTRDNSSSGMIANVINSPAEIDLVPQDYCINNKVETRCPVSHSLSRPVTEISKLVKKNGTGKCMMAFAFVEDGMRSVT